jgi:antitoxin HicB
MNMKKNIKYYLDLPYSIVVKRDKDNAGEVCYIARVLEIPHVIGDGKTAEEAIEVLNVHMHMAIKAYLRDGLPVPEPQTEYSGNINIRVDPELHARLAQEAAAYDMSLNKYAALILERRKSGMYDSQPSMVREARAGVKAKGRKYR